MIAVSKVDIQVRKKTHGKGRQGGDGGGSGDNVAPDLGLAELVLLVRVADGVGRPAVTHAGSASVRYYRRVHGDDVRHSEERGDTRAYLGEESRPLTLLGLFFTTSCPCVSDSSRRWVWRMGLILCTRFSPLTCPEPSSLNHRPTGLLAILRFVL